jgi:hypothetical protein
VFSFGLLQAPGEQVTQTWKQLTSGKIIHKPAHIIDRSNQPCGNEQHFQLFVCETAPEHNSE